MDLSIVRIEGMPIEDAVITQGRERGSESNVQTWGLRPKMRVIFQMTKQREATSEPMEEKKRQADTVISNFMVQD